MYKVYTEREKKKGKGRGEERSGACFSTKPVFTHKLT
jgi:hypothetical protein